MSLWGYKQDVARTVLSNMRVLFTFPALEQNTSFYNKPSNKTKTPNTEQNIEHSKDTEHDTEQNNEQNKRQSPVEAIGVKAIIPK